MASGQTRIDCKTNAGECEFSLTLNTKCGLSAFICFKFKWVENFFPNKTSGGHIYALLEDTITYDANCSSSCKLLCPRTHTD